MRDLIVKNVLSMYPELTFIGNFQVLLTTLRPGVLAQIPIGATPAQAANVVVDLATIHNWLRALVAKIPVNPSNAAEMAAINAWLAAQPMPTTANPFDEVLLEGNRPFVNRKDLRARLKELCAGTTTVLLINGEPQTGKTFSFYLAQHMARQHSFITSQFAVRKTPKPRELAAEILDRIGVNVSLCDQGQESAERWAEKLAAQVKNAIEAAKLPRLFVFDDFPVKPQPSLPPETMSFIVRLATYSDQELRPLLRVLLIQFGADLPPELDDVAERDEAVAFTEDDMLSVLRQVRQAHGWSVDDQGLCDEMKALNGAAALRERFQFLKKTIRKLATPAGPVANGGVI